MGRNYLNLARGDAKPTEKEIIIDVPLAIKLAFQVSGGGRVHLHTAVGLL